VTSGIGRELAVDAEVSRGEFTLRVNLAVAPGEVLGILGPNGSGKSTLLNAVAGLMPVSRGQILLDGQVIDDAATGEFLEAAERPVGFVFQNYRLFPHMSVLDNVAFAPRARGINRHEARATASDWLARLGLARFAGRRPADLSGGQAQRVALARALAGRPRVVIADEITSALDVSIQGAVLNLVRELQRELGLSILFISHNLAVVRYVSTRLAVMYRGRIVEQGPTDRVLAEPRDDYTRELLAAVPGPTAPTDRSTP